MPFKYNNRPLAVDAIVDRETQSSLFTKPHPKPNLSIMKTALLLPLLVIATSLHGTDEPGFVSLFNGKNLDGWDGKPGAWEIRDGEIWCTGASIERNWLIWRGGEPSDFTLRLEFRWDKGNSGVQVRSDDLGEWQVFGYQVEIARQEVMGLWHHSLISRDHPKREARFLMTTAGERAVINKAGERKNTKLEDAAAVQAHYKENEWNTMEIIATGDMIIQMINGIHFATIIDHDSEMSRSKGFIAFQDHGKGCTVAFRNIRLKTSKP